MTKIFPMRVRRVEKRPAPEVQADAHVDDWLVHYVRPKKVKPPRPPRPKPVPVDPLAMMLTLFDQIELDLPRAIKDYATLSAFFSRGDGELRHDLSVLRRHVAAAKSLEIMSLHALVTARMDGVSPVSYAPAIRWGDRAKDAGTDPVILLQIALDHNRAIRRVAREIIRKLPDGGGPRCFPG